MSIKINQSIILIDIDANNKSIHELYHSLSS